MLVRGYFGLSGGAMLEVTLWHVQDSPHSPSQSRITSHLFENSHIPLGAILVFTKFVEGLFWQGDVLDIWEFIDGPRGVKEKQ